MSDLILPDGMSGTSIPAEDLVIKPYGGLILVEKIAESDRTAGGIVLTSKSSESLRVPRWRVLAVGNGYPMTNGVWRTPEVSVGDVLILAPHEAGRGQWFQAPSSSTVKRRLVDENCILAKVEGDGELSVNIEEVRPSPVELQ